MLVKLSNLINRESTLNSWLPFIKCAWAWKHCGLSAAPSQERHAWTWRKDVPTYFSRLVAGTQQSSEPSPRKSTAARPQRRRAWADVEETSCLNSCSKTHQTTWHEMTSHHITSHVANNHINSPQVTSEPTTLLHQNTSPQQMPTLFESSEQRFNQSRLSQTIL